MTPPLRRAISSPALIPAPPPVLSADRVRPWTLLVADGVLGLVAGALALAYPGITVLVLAVLLGVALIGQGIAEVVATRQAMPHTAGRIWTAVLAIIALTAGVLCIVQPGAGLFGVVLGVEVWFIVAGVNEIVVGIALEEDRLWNVLLGIISLLSAAVLFLLPGLALWTAALLTGVFFLARGAGQVTTGLRLRRSFT